MEYLGAKRYFWVILELVQKAFLSQRKGKVISCRWTEDRKRRGNQQWKVWYEESGGWEPQKQSGEYGRVCKVECQRLTGAQLCCDGDQPL